MKIKLDDSIALWFLDYTNCTFNETFYWELILMIKVHFTVSLWNYEINKAKNLAESIVFFIDDSEIKDDYW